MEFRLNDGPPLPLEAGKASALLAYLAVEAASPHHRQSLAELLWPERADADALGALRFALSNLRAALRDRQAAVPFLLIERSRVQLNPDANVWVDVTAFRQQTAACEAASRQDNAPPVAALQAALALYRGDFMQGFNLGDSLDFESWALRAREHLERQRVALLRRLGSAQEAAGDHAQAAEAYRAILAFQPWDEDAHRGVMRALAAHGEPAAALAHYATCRRALRELGIAPGAATTALYWRIQQEHGMADAEAAVPAVPFVVRERELARLSAALERVLAGQGQTVLITGEAGSGKTALLNAFARQALARAPDLLVVGGRCDAYAGMGQPYQPFIECVQMLVGEWDALPWAEQLPPEGQERLRQALPQVAQALVENAPVLLERVVNRAALRQRVQPAGADARPLPAWQALLRDGAAAPALPGGLETDRLFEEAARLFTALHRQRPLVLLVDDLQWSDAGSAALLFHIARRFVHSRVLLVAAYRPGDVGDRAGAGPHPLLGIVTELQRYGGDIRVDLDRVDEQAFVAAFLEQDPLLHPHRLDAAFCAALARRTGGNPLFTIELLRSLQAHHDLQRAADGRWETSPTLNWEHMPERVEAAIAGRIARLPEAWRDWLATAAVEGESFTAEVLARVHGVDVAGLRRELSGPLGMGRGGRRLVQGESARPVGESAPTRYRFRHILFQVYLYQQLDPVERARRHTAVGAALEELYDGLPEERARHAAELARHFECGGLPEKAAVYHLEAGRRAVYLASPQVAIAHYRRGLALLADAPHTPARDRLEIHLYLALGAPFLLAGGWGGAERQEAIQRALALLQEKGQAELTGDQPPGLTWAGSEPGGPDDLLLALYELADWTLNQGEFAQAGRLGEQLLELAGESPGLAQALAYRILGYSRLFQGDFPGARRRLEEALTVYDASGQPAALPWAGGDLGVICRAALGFALAVSGYLDQAWAQTTQALHRARRLKVAAIQGAPLIFACEVAVLRGDWPALRALADELLHVGQTTELPVFLAYSWAVGGYVQALHARPGSAQAEASLDMIRRGMQVWESARTPMGRGLWTVRLAAACLHAGEIAAGLSLTQKVLEAPDQPGIAIGLAQIYRLHGELLLRQAPSDRSAAEVCFRRAIEIARQQEARTLELRAALSLARLWQAEQAEEARRLIAEVYGWFVEGFETPDLQEAAAALSPRAF
ncbi:MAG TPA: AAA family ATPase [Anaerolineae bacterium]|nr:AAA family ATPase [Anaerolineae bacterium]